MIKIIQSVYLDSSGRKFENVYRCTVYDSC